ncbi:hypothetical protein K435DRAFT_967694 [Dendrothele bispora CBS 962.96]|uniref:Uncharacterized protein n=1 Tax=Dendrothele bispora (strain CBS 962.96) TaxID=1314807 RepID=A0A4S8LSW0_DENBC|nr:hypothetical protein K435DRAFT_967694 [Dendrothele bispora CBS 962.96]
MDATDEYASLWKHAVEKFEKNHGQKLPQYTEATRDRTPDDILTEAGDKFTKFRDNGKILRSAVKPCMDSVSRLSEVLGQTLQLVYPPAQAITAAVVVFIKVVMIFITFSHLTIIALMRVHSKGCEQVSTNYDAMEDLLDNYQHILERTETLARLKPSDNLKRLIVDILVQFLNVVDLAVNAVKSGRRRAFFKSLVFKKDTKIEKALGEVEKLLRREEASVNLAILTKTHAVQESTERHYSAVSSTTIHRWLNPINQIEKYEEVLRQRSEGTCQWFLEDQTFSNWKEKPNSRLWFHGKMGAGKTMIRYVKTLAIKKKIGLKNFSTTAIENLSRLPGLVAYYYFQFDQKETLSEHSLIRSLLAQLKTINSTPLKTLHKALDGATQPSISQLQKALEQIVSSAKCPIYIVIDALDEYVQRVDHVYPERDQPLLSLLGETVSWNAPNLHMMVTSRDEPGIEKVIKKAGFMDIKVSTPSIDKDIALYVKAELSKDKWRQWDLSLREKVQERMLKKGNGMFRLVVSHFELLEQAGTDEDVEWFVENLPDTLRQT